jgi:hypothetical protein
VLLEFGHESSLGLRQAWRGWVKNKHNAYSDDEWDKHKAPWTVLTKKIKTECRDTRTKGNSVWGPPSTEAKMMSVPCQQVIALFLISGLFLSVRLGELIILVTVAIRLVVREARQNNLDQLITKETRVATIRKLGGMTKDAFMTTQGS